MPTTNNFNNRLIYEPGFYSRITYGGQVLTFASSYGNVCLIDTNKNAGYGGGSGINGELASKKKAIYEFTDREEAKAFLKGGLFWDLMDYLFSPSNNGNGIPKIYLIKAATTEAAGITLSFNAGTIVCKARTEGLFGNGVISSSKVRKGYGAKVIAGIIDPNKFIVELQEGQFHGLDADSDPYDGILQADAEPLIIRSPEVQDIDEIIDWMKNDAVFNNYFIFSSFTEPTTTTTTTSGTTTTTTTVATWYGDLIPSDISNNPLTAFSGGTESYTNDDLDDALACISELDNSFFLCDQYGSESGGVKNNKILTYINNDSEFSKIMFVGGGSDSTEFSNYSIATALAYNTSKVTVVRSGVQVPKVIGSGLKDKDSIYTAALALGRIAGLEPQVPGTRKDLRIISPIHDLTANERRQALIGGVLHMKYIPLLGWVINQSINTLQKNTQLINPDGQSFEISITRISNQLNKEMVLNGRINFIGGNANTVSPVEIKSFVESFLRQRTATKTVDGLILLFQNVKVTLKGDSYYVTYEYMPNGPINKIFSHLVSH